MVDTQGSLRDRLIRIETKQDTGNEKLAKLVEHVEAQNGRIRAIETWQSNRSFLEKISVGALRITGVAALLAFIVKMAGKIFG